ncbi:hypothetical protein RFI_34980 [Reticulomyxa filosa]|uniref:Uncharacterized protein n=1 Tax=Reticulomyxa filosa TaxID=46433 RepID=X6LM80_RETFI|nr:hypothetical protein RFI_34980 [Reticulomyxa filosa]|eukprot:ETO02451.1 hypothetical protein RFI_34980 [Reticulomyxa filosa]
MPEMTCGGNFEALSLKTKDINMLEVYDFEYEERFESSLVVTSLAVTKCLSSGMIATKKRKKLPKEKLFFNMMELLVADFFRCCLLETLHRQQLHCLKTFANSSYLS